MQVYIPILHPLIFRSVNHGLVMNNKKNIEEFIVKKKKKLLKNLYSVVSSFGNINGVK